MADKRKLDNAACADGDTHERDMKRARTSSAPDSDLPIEDAVTAGGESLNGSSSRPPESSTSTVDDALKKVAEELARERASPFNPSSGLTGPWGNIFGKHILPYLAAEDTTALRLQSRFVCRLVDQCGRVSLKQFAHLISNPLVCGRALDVAVRLLEQTTSLLDIVLMVLCAAFRSADPEQSCKILDLVFPKIKSFQPGASRISVLFGACLHKQIQNESVLDWPAICRGQPLPATIRYRVDWIKADMFGSKILDGMADALHLSRSESPGNTFADAEKAVQIVALAAVTNFRYYTTRMPRMSAKLMRLLIANRVFDAHAVCLQASDIANVLILRMEALAERVRPPIHVQLPAPASGANFTVSTSLTLPPLSASEQIKPELGALEFLLELLDDCGVRGTSFQQAINSAVSLPVPAPLLQVLRVPVLLKTTSSAPPLTRAVQHNNSVGLRYFCASARDEGIIPRAQKRLVDIAMNNGLLECVKVLCTEFPVFAPPEVVKIVVAAPSDLSWPKEPKWRKIAFEAALSDIAVSVSRGAPAGMIRSISEKLDLRIFESGRVTVSAWEATLLIEFLGALWEATSGDERCRSALAGSAEFRSALPRALIAALHGWVVPPNGPKRTKAQNYLMEVGINAVAKLLDMQRLCDSTSDIENGSAKAVFRDTLSGEVFDTSATGVVLDRWLRIAFASVAQYGWAHVQRLEDQSKEISGMIEAELVHTDNTFKRVFCSPDGVPPFVTQVWAIHMLCRVCLQYDKANRAILQRSTLARRLIRWCFHASAFITSYDTIEHALEVFCILERLADGVIANADETGNHFTVFFNAATLEPTNPEPHRGDLDANVMQEAFADLSGKLERFVVNTCASRLTGVETLFLKYGGNVERALGVMTAEHAVGALIPEPEGAVREIVVYIMASMQGEESREVFSAINRVMRAYTTGVTLPSSVSVIGAFGGLKSLGFMSRWLRDLLRGRTPHTVWWSADAGNT